MNWDLNLYFLRWLWTWVRDIALFIGLFVVLIFCWIFDVEWL